MYRDTIQTLGRLSYMQGYHSISRQTADICRDTTESLRRLTYTQGYQRDSRQTVAICRDTTESLGRLQLRIPQYPYIVSLDILQSPYRLYGIPTYSCSLPRDSMVSLHIAAVSLETLWYPYIQLQSPQILYGKQKNAGRATSRNCSQPPTPTMYKSANEIPKLTGSYKLLS